LHIGSVFERFVETHLVKAYKLKLVIEMADTTVDATRRLNVKKQTLDDAYAAPANFLEIDVINPITHGVGKKRYTDYEVRMRVSNIPFRFKYLCTVKRFVHLTRRNFV